MYLRTEEVHFMFNDEIYIQNDRVVMGSPLGPLLASIFMASLEEEVIPKIGRDMLTTHTPMLIPKELLLS